MGTLDDAISEHLELNKRSGATDEEVQRLQTEVFGPARAAPAPEVPPEPEPEPAAAEPQPEPEPEPAQPAGEPWLDEEPDEVPIDDALEHPRQQQTSEFTAAEAADASGAPPADYVAPDEEDADDLLEETPDFLQETPEHERLWFEQKPPRDFDFDE